MLANSKVVFYFQLELKTGFGCRSRVKENVFNVLLVRAGGRDVFFSICSTEDSFLLFLAIVEDSNPEGPYSNTFPNLAGSI